MTTVEKIGEMVYRKIVTPKFSTDRQSWTAGCVVHGEGCSMFVRFYRYERGKGIVGSSRPSSEIVELLKNHGGEMKEYLIKSDERERASSVSSSIKKMKNRKNLRQVDASA